MKKILLTVLLAVAMVVPVFATEKGAMEVDAKLGLIVEPLFMDTYYDGNEKYGYNTDSTFSLGADFYYYVMNNLGVGLGVNHIFESRFDAGWNDKDKLSSTNVYLAIKPILAENGLVDKVYLLGQLGVGLNSFKIGENSEDDWDSTGLYWGFGFGVEKYNVILEFVYSVGYLGKEKANWGADDSYTIRNLAINAGYKFSL